MHTSRAAVVGMVVGLSIYVSGFQKAVLEPVLEAFSDWSNAVQLGILSALVAGGVAVALWKVRDRRRRLDAARDSIAAFASASTSATTVE